MADNRRLTVRWKTSPPSPAEGEASLPSGNDRSEPCPVPRPTPWSARPRTGEEFHLPRIGAMLRRRRWTIVFGTLFVLAAVAGLTHLWPRTYESDVTILVERRTPWVDSPALAVLERLGAANETETEMELVKSRRVIEAVVDQLDLHVVVETSTGGRRPGEVFAAFDASRDVEPGSYRILRLPLDAYVIQDVRTDTLVARAIPGEQTAFAGIELTLPVAGLEGEVILNAAAFTEAAQAVRKRVEVSRVRREADLIELTCKARTAQGVQELCAGISDSYTHLRAELQRAEGTATAAFLREQVAQLAKRLAAAEDSLEAYTRRSQAVALEERASDNARQYAQLRAQREGLEAERSALAGLIGDIERQERDHRKYRDLASFPTFLQNLAVTELLTSLVDLENRRSELAVRRTERTPGLAALDARIAEIEHQLLAMALSYEQALSVQIEALDVRLAGAGQRLAVIPTQPARLERQAMLLEELYRLLETRLHEAEVAEAVNLPSVRVVDSASLPLHPAAPNLPLNLALGLIFGLSSSLTLALYKDIRDTRVRDRQEVERDTGLPVLSMIPELKRPSPVLPLKLLARSIAGKLPPGANAATQIVVPARNGHNASAQMTEERLVALESFRSLAADLRFAEKRLDNGGRIKKVVITSAGRGDGKTFAACNLALVRAAHGGRTLLIDGDMRAGRVAQFFDFASASPGLSDVLAGWVSLQAVWKGMRVKDSELWIVPSGTPTPHSAGLVESARFGLLLERAQLKFDFIVIDTPPLNVITDAATIAAVADAVVLVVRPGFTDRQALEITLQRLERAGVFVVGTVLNGVELPPQYVSNYQYF